ncbi:alanine--tRNA ligase [Mucilaginibacter gossypii]|uniref:alanine--tRNA ligase n=1 Tax=Mucilaginibacter gossypii TaxID=551996 RepID=UPI000DCF19D9|nr:MULTISPECIES: alanine--tRNA ligase [Mucilaginibacter]QTE39525.1 alanine--tRNA ligase [Mucilaginibacter gossypii]RAV56113.1 alanine--tRNA ligase [Mucilaginibacter rubeus]
MTATEIRQAFLDFFVSKGHTIVPSAPIVIKNDPTLMFTNAGMNQFKDIFLGEAAPKASRVADTQRCLRVSGKHNDLEEVGIDTYHHTMFEMLGNWSFGDYFKKEAIAWSWELLTEVYKLPKDRLYVTYFEGDEKEGLEADTETYELWKQYVAEDHILRGNKKDNFWEMGETGPCGPCSEIHFDSRPDNERAEVSGATLVNADHDQVIEIWNDVFMQFNRLKGGVLQPLPNKHVDTGMGFERLVRVLQGKTSNYDTDVFQPMIQFIAEKSGKKYYSSANPFNDQLSDEEVDQNGGSGDGAGDGFGEGFGGGSGAGAGEDDGSGYGDRWGQYTDNWNNAVAMRVIADHIRAISFAIADGQLPSNNKAGYVIRRILRRAVRYSYQYLGFKEPFVNQLVPMLAEQFKGVFDELYNQKEFVQKVVLEEEASFLRTLSSGIRKFREAMFGDVKVISGKVAFELSDTYGFPIDLTELMARENGLTVDLDGFEKELQEQKTRSRAATAIDTGDWIVLKDDESVEFTGYDETETIAHIVKYRKVTAKGKEQYQLVLDKTPFYAESGGQVGDKGELVFPDGEIILVTDTKKENGLIVHFTDKLPQDIDDALTAIVDPALRSQTNSNHSATHLLHAAMKQILGTHVNQKGSLVNADYLRFDFSHFAKVTDEELAQIEAIVNQKVRENIPLKEERSVLYAEAISSGVTALFGEKYGEYVRVITFDDSFSKELCGGTHVKATGQIGFFKIIAESAVAAGVRRIEAITGVAAEKYIVTQNALVNQLKELLKNPKDLSKSIEGLLDENAKLKKEIEKSILEKSSGLKTELAQKVEAIGDINFIAQKVALPNADAVKNLAYQLKDIVSNLFLVLVADFDGKPSITVMIAENLVKEKGLHAGNIVKELAKEVKGGGGGQPFFATAGGSDVSGLDKVLMKARSFAG